MCKGSTICYSNKKHIVNRPGALLTCGAQCKHACSLFPSPVSTLRITNWVRFVCMWLLVTVQIVTCWRGLWEECRWTASKAKEQQTAENEEMDGKEECTVTLLRSKVSNEPLSVGLGPQQAMQVLLICSLFCFRGLHFAWNNIMGVWVWQAKCTWGVCSCYSISYLDRRQHSTSFLREWCQLRRGQHSASFFLYYRSKNWFHLIWNNFLW